MLVCWLFDFVGRLFLLIGYLAAWLVGLFVIHLFCLLGCFAAWLVGLLVLDLFGWLVLFDCFVSFA